MDYLSATQLRTQVPLLVKMLISGKTVKLLHRSKIIGQVVPLESEQTKIFRGADLLRATRGLKLRKYSHSQVKAKYKLAIRSRHG